MQIIGKPKLRYSNKGDAILTVSQNVAPGTRNKQSGQWEQVGLDQWVQGVIFAPRDDRDPDPQLIADNCPDGWRVILSADRVKRSEFTGRDGVTRSQDELQWPRFVGYEPPYNLIRHRGGVQEASGGAYSQQPPNGSPNDPWVAQGASYDEQPPF